MYRRTDSGPVFVQADSPTDEALQALLHKIITRLMKLLTRRGVRVEEEEEEEGSSYLADADADADADSDEACTLRPLQAAACAYRVAFGPRAGQMVFTVQGAMPQDAARPLWARIGTSMRPRKPLDRRIGCERGMRTPATISAARLPAVHDPMRAAPLWERRSGAVIRGADTQVPEAGPPPGRVHARVGSRGCHRGCAGKAASAQCSGSAFAVFLFFILLSISCPGVSVRCRWCVEVR